MNTKPITFSGLVVRSGLCIAALFLIYMIFGPPNYVELELINVILYIFIVPAVLILVTIILAIIIANLFWYVPAVNNWWLNNTFAQISCCLVSIGLLIFPIFYNYSNANEKNGVTEFINIYAITGWFLTALCFFIIQPKSILKKTGKTAV